MPTRSDSAVSGESGVGFGLGEELSARGHPRGCCFARSTLASLGYAGPSTAVLTYVAPVHPAVHRCTFSSVQPIKVSTYRSTESTPPHPGSCTASPPIPHA
eukprot:6179479-Pleurochrysis_carterae.AAC.1